MMRFFKAKKNTEDKIKEATFELLADRGYAATSMRDIAKKAQTAVGQLTYYYGTKEHLIISVIEEMINMAITELEKYMNKSEDKIKAINTFFDELYEKEEKVFKVIIDFTAQSIWNDKFKMTIKNFFEKTSNLIRKAYGEIEDDIDVIEEKTELLMTIISGQALQHVLDFEFVSNVKDKFCEKERKLFNAKPANGLL